VIGARWLAATARRIRDRLRPPAPDGDRPVCAALWDTPMVHVGGDLTTCCLDEGLENRLGNVRDTPLAALWEGETLQRWRQAQIEGRFADSGPFCTRCNWRSAGTMTAARVEDYLRVRGDTRALRHYHRRTHARRHPH
jgi:radical SAM protein with 4Fe4S-binding SPASM domain